jgi:hypothetical protein
VQIKGSKYTIFGTHQLLYRNNNRIKKLEMSIGLKPMFCGSIFVAGKNCEYLLLTEGQTCGLVFSNVVISVLFDYMLIDV